MEPSPGTGAMTSDDEGRFLSRWSQRKREAIKEAEKQAVQPAEPAPVPVEPEEEDFDLSLLPSLEELTPATDLTLFFKKGVPEMLRNAALRKMWTLDPAIRDYRSEALDYAWDWNAPGGVPGGGDLPADYDSSEMVARIFGDEPVDKKLIEHAAAQQSQTSGNIQPANVPSEFGAEPVKLVKYEQDQIDNESISPISVDVPVPKKHRHGRALPINPTKL